MPSTLLNASKQTVRIAAVKKKIHHLREEMANLQDYLDVLEARALYFGKRRFSSKEVGKKLGVR
jgi:hypothetical protein